jgi:hypothetical protein
MWYFVIAVMAVAIVAFIIVTRGRRRHVITNPATSGVLNMSKQLNVGGTSNATVVYDDKAGTAVAVDSVPAWTVDLPNVASIAPAADGMSAVVTALAVGVATVTVVAEGDPTAGVDTITLSGTVTVVDEASGGTLTFD